MIKFISHTLFYGCIFVLIFFLGSRPYVDALLKASILNAPLVEEVWLSAGSLEQGISKVDNQNRQFYISSNHPSIYKYDANWNLLESRKYSFEDIAKPHIGIISYANGRIWAPVIDLDSYLRRRANTRLVEINLDDLRIVNIIDTSKQMLYVDAFDFHEDHLYVSYKNWLTVYRVVDSHLILIKRFRIATGTAQGMRFDKDGQKVCMIGENNLMRIRGLPDGLYCYRLGDLVEFNEKWYLNALGWVESIASSISYLFNMPILSRYLDYGMNFPSQVYRFGYPIGNPDNEGFDFLHEAETYIWVSDSHGQVARKLMLPKFKSGAIGVATRSE